MEWIKYFRSEKYAIRGPCQSRRSGGTEEWKGVRRRVDGVDEATLCVLMMSLLLQHSGQGRSAHNDDPVAIEPDGPLFFQGFEGAADHLPGRPHDSGHLLLGESLP